MDMVIYVIVVVVSIVSVSFVWYRTGRKNHSKHMAKQIETQREDLLSDIAKKYSWSEVDEIFHNLLKENDV